MHKIVIIGAGFAGIGAANTLLKDLPEDYEVVMINSTNYFLFVPLIYEVATGVIGRHNVVEAVREVIRHPRFRFIREQVTKVDVKKKQVICDTFKTDYEYLVISTGAQANYYGVKGAKENSMVLGNLRDSYTIRTRLVKSLEDASKAKTREEQEKCLTYVVIGGGATGVQLAGGISDFLEHNLKKHYSHLDVKPKVYLIQALEKILTMFSERTIDIAMKKLEKKGLKVMVSTPVTEVGKDFVVIKGKEKISSNTIVWAGGIRPADLETVPRLQDQKGYFEVDKTLQVIGHEDIFALGDCSYVKDSPVPQLAQAAKDEGIIAAKNLLRHIRKEAPVEYTFKNKGVLVAIGEGYALGELYLGKRIIRVRGLLIWFLKRHIYWMNLVGLQNKLRVGAEWFLNLIFPRDSSEI